MSQKHAKPQSSSERLLKDRIFSPPNNAYGLRGGCSFVVTMGQKSLPQFIWAVSLAIVSAASSQAEPGTHQQGRRNAGFVLLT
jgi:hypothetical protein